MDNRKTIYLSFKEKDKDRKGGSVKIRLEDDIEAGLCNDSKFLHCIKVNKEGVESDCWINKDFIKAIGV